MRMDRTSRILLATLLFGVTAAQAAVVPGRWEKVSSLENGRQISVFLKSGMRLQSTFQELQTDALVVKVSDGSEKQIPKTEIHRIASRGKDSSWDGAAIGAGAGLAAGLLISAVQYSGDQEARTIGNVVYAPIGAVSGLIAGYAADRLRQKEELLYIAQ